ncbi:unnamed protein product [Paramecium pentaurelia]|uniref:Uncharacterized protein n=1 Tax=Paramecium pentaurelia TaxID=43138 RepID=A0A8S1T5H2_9CILI|nr:unnamed protein product [Paramecium pentaurelia]
MINQPNSIIELPFQVSTSHILDLFISCTKKKQYQILEKDSNQIIAIKENVAVIKNTLKRMICIQENTFEQICLVKIQIDTNQVKCVRIVSIRGITGHYDENQELINYFLSKIDKLRNKKTQDQNMMNEASEFVGIVNVSEEMENPANQNPYYLETSAYYMFHKLLCASNYGLGKKVAEYIQKLQNNLNNDQTNIKQNVQQLNAFINQIVETLFQSFNFGKQETTQIMPYCKISIEKYFYLKLSHCILPQYQNMFKQQNELFRSKKIDRNNIQIKSDLHKDLQIPEFNSQQTIRITEALNELDKIEYMSYPREKLRCLQLMNAILKAINSGLIDQLVKSSILRNLITHRFNKFTRQTIPEQNLSSIRRNNQFLIYQFQLIQFINKKTYKRMNNFDEDPNPNSTGLINKLASGTKNVVTGTVNSVGYGIWWAGSGIVNASGNLLHLGKGGFSKTPKAQENNELKGQQLVNINK